MDLQTKIPLKPNQHGQIDYDAKVVLMGSCFSEHIGSKFDYYKFQFLENPFGILFQPLAIESLVTRAINEQTYTKEDTFFLNEQWHCFDAHSRLSNSSQEQLLHDLNTNLHQTRHFLEQATHVIITLGTAWTYR